MWLATPAPFRRQRTLGEFIAVWKCSERTLSLFHVRRGFLEDLVREMRPWLERVQNIRLAIFNNATDPKRSDQLVWMRLYEDMLVESMGETHRFLPRPRGDDPDEQGARGGSGSRKPGKGATRPAAEARIPIT